MAPGSNSPAPTYGDKVFGLLARGAYNVLTLNRKEWKATAFDAITKAVPVVVKMAHDNAPGGLEGTFLGPLLKTLSNAEGDITDNLKSVFDTLYERTCSVLDTRATNSKV